MYIHIYMSVFFAYKNMCIYSSVSLIHDTGKQRHWSPPRKGTRPAHLSIRPPVRTPACAPDRPSARLSIRPPARTSIHPHAGLSVRPPICPSDRYIIPNITFHMRSICRMAASGLSGLYR